MKIKDPHYCLEMKIVKFGIFQRNTHQFGHEISNVISHLLMIVENLVGLLTLGHFSINIARKYWRWQLNINNGLDSAFAWIVDWRIWPYSKIMVWLLLMILVAILFA